MLTIKRMHTYAELFALGEKTGCELHETAGIMSDPVTYAERHFGAEWFDGLTIQAAIGQCDNMFTPIELATYCAMIANGGTPKDIADAQDLWIKEDSDLLAKTVDEIIANNPKAAEQYRSGDQKVFGFVMGQANKALKGLASPKAIQEYIKKKLSE